MAQKQHLNADPSSEPKKRRRVGFSNTDAGLDPKDCIWIYMVSSKEEVGAPDSFCLDSVDYGNFLEEDGKIYGYQGLKICIWINSISFRSYSEVTFESKSDGGKGITDLESLLKNMFAETLVENKDDFLETFSKDAQYIRSVISSGNVIEQKVSNGHSSDSNHHREEAVSDLEVVRMVMGNMDSGHLYSRLVPLVLLLVDGSNPIDVTDPSWEMYVLVEKSPSQNGNDQNKVLGFAALYRFYHYPAGSRLRLGQILVLPPYQHRGYGAHLLNVLNKVAITEEVYDFTIEEPLESLQRIRTCIDVSRLHTFGPVQDAVKSSVSYLKQGKLSKKTYIPRLLPSAKVVEEVRKSFKINKKQFLQCWDILVYLGLDAANTDFFSIISNRVRSDILGKDSDTAGKKVIEVESEYDPEMSFVMFRSGVEGGEGKSVVQVDESQRDQEEQLQQLVDARIEEIKLISSKVSQLVK